VVTAAFHDHLAGLLVVEGTWLLASAEIYDGCAVTTRLWFGLILFLHANDTATALGCITPPDPD
jgi:hypothetical protein